MNENDRKWFLRGFIRGIEVIMIDENNRRKHWIKEIKKLKQNLIIK